MIVQPLTGSAFSTDATHSDRAAGGFLDLHELNIVWWAMALSVAVVFVLGTPWIFAPAQPGWFFVTTATIVLGVSRWFIQKNKPVWACWALVGPGWLLFAALSVLRNGVDDVAVSFLIMYPVVAGLLLGRRAAAGLFLASCAVIGLDTYVAVYGVEMSYRLPPATRGSSALLFCASAWIAFVALYLAHRRVSLGEVARQSEEVARQAAEQEVQRNRTDLAVMMANMPVAMVLFDENLRFKSANPIFFDFFPELLPVSEHLHSVRNLFHHFSAPGAIERAGRLRPGESFRIEAPCVAGSEGFRGFEVSVFRNGEAEMAVLVVDQTERQRQLAEITRRERMYRQLADALPIGVAIYSDYRVVFANEAGARILGRPSVASLIGAHVMELFPGYETEVRARTRRAMRLGEHQMPVRRHLRLPDGRDVVIESTAVQFGTDDSLGVLSIFHDITDRVQADEAKRVAEQRVRATVENAPNVATQWFTRDGRIVYWNTACEQLWGIPAEAAVGKTLADVRGPVVAKMIDEAMARIEATGKPLGPIEFSSPHADGSEKRLLVTVFSIPGDHLGPYYARMAVDITELHTVREALRAANAALEDKVAARTAELVTSNADLDAFASSVSHDLRAPIHNILMLIDRLKSANAAAQTADMARYLDLLADVGTRMNEIVDALLNFAREGRSDLHWTRIPLSALVHEVVQFLESAAEHPGRIRWNIEVADDVRGDIGLIRIVLVNLIGNAVKFSAKRPQPAIAVTSTRRAGWVEIAIADNGAGFDPRYAHKLFGLFSRLHSASDYEGIGIGLVTCQRIVNRHGGGIVAEGMPNEGATFSFTLPVWTEATVKATPLLAPQASASEVIATGNMQNSQE